MTARESSSPLLRTADRGSGSGKTTQLGFFGRGDARMFGVLDLPGRAARAGVLICSPIQSEFLINYRRELWLARALANVGVAVCRFHYRGTGHSDEADLTFGSMCVDAYEAVGWMRQHVGDCDLGFLGTRWGSVVAAAVARDFPASPLAMWSPALHGDTYLREIFRLRKMARLSQGESSSGSDPFDEVARNRHADVFGFEIGASFVESIRGRGVTEEIGQLHRPIFIAQVDPQKRLRADYGKVVDLWRTSGFSVDVHLEEGQEAWWFPGAQWREDAIVRGRSLVTETMRWFSSRFEGVAVG